MEDIPRDLQRDLARIRSTPVPRRKRRWTLLFVGDNGDVVTFHRFKGWVMFYFTLLAAALAAAGILWVTSRDPARENRRLTRELAELRGQLEEAKAEKDLMMARMVVAASRSGEAPDAAANDASPTQAPAAVVKTPPAGPATPAKTPEKVTAAPASAVKPPAQVQAQAKAPASTPSAPEPPASPAAETAVVVDVEALRVTHDIDNQMLHAQFMLKKVDTEQGSVSGRTFVILKEKTAPSSQWLSMPSVPLEEGHPSRVRNGRYFSISRFNIVKFSTPFQDSAEAFDSASVLVYSLQGDLLLEKNFVIRVALGAPDDQDIGE